MSGRVLIIGNENTTSLAILRSIGERYEVWGACLDGEPKSRFWKGNIGEVTADSNIFGKFDAVVPVGFREVAPLVYAGIENLPWGNWSVFSRAHDKSYLSEEWSGEYPCAVKPKSWCGASEVYRCETPEDRKIAMKRISNLDDNPPLSDSTPITQDWWQGDIHDVVILSQDGEIWGLVAQRRVITNPPYPHGGPGCLNVTLDPEDQFTKGLISRARKIVSRIRWTGPAQLEFRQGHLVEMNAKLWGTYPLSIAAGHDFSEAIVLQAMGRDLPDPPNGYKPHVWCGFWPTLLRQESRWSLKAWKTALAPAIRANDVKSEIYRGCSVLYRSLRSLGGRI